MVFLGKKFSVSKFDGKHFSVSDMGRQIFRKHFMPYKILFLQKKIMSQQLGAKTNCNFVSSCAMKREKKLTTKKLLKKIGVYESCISGIRWRRFRRNFVPIKNLSTPRHRVYLELRRSPEHEPLPFSFIKTGIILQTKLV